VDFAQSIDSLAERALGLVSNRTRARVADESFAYSHEVVGGCAECTRRRDFEQYQTSIFNAHFKLIVGVDPEHLAELGGHNDPSQLI
jgi:hypothetical protein